MKRLILLLIAAIAVPAFGLTVTPHRGDYEDLLRQGPGGADYYVEVVSGYASGRPVGAMAAAVQG